MWSGRGQSGLRKRCRVAYSLDLFLVLFNYPAQTNHVTSKHTHKKKGKEKKRGQGSRHRSSPLVKCDVSENKVKEFQEKNT